MASSWIRFSKDLPVKPEVFSIASMLDLSCDDVVGKLMRFWSWVDDSTDTGIIKILASGEPDRVAARTIDSVVSCDGFCHALEQVCWVFVQKNGVIIVPKHDRYMSNSAKSRMVKHERQKKYRERRVVDDIASPEAAPQPKEEAKEAKPADEPKGGRYTKEFESWWSLYPSGRRVGKGAAFRSFKAAKKKTSVENLHRAIEAQKKSEAWTKDGGRFIPHPSTWLNQERWEDDVIIESDRPRKEPEFRKILYESDEGIAVKTFRSDVEMNSFIKGNGLSLDPGACIYRRGGG